MRFRLAALLFSASIVTAPVAHAQTHFKFVGAGSFTAFGYYVGPYSGTMGTGASAKTVTLNCVDFFHEVTWNQEWNANLSNIGTGTGIGTWSRSSNVTLYKEAAWLSQQYAGKTSSAVVGDIQATIWNLFGNASAKPSSNYWLLQAQANYASQSYNNYVVVTDVDKNNPASVQEFIIHTTPEPASMVLTGTGLAGLGLVARRRKRNAA